MAHGMRIAMAALVTGAVVATTVGVAVPAQAKAPAGRFAVGDSVMLGAKSALSAPGRGFRVDASVSRQFDKADNVLRAKRSALPANVVVALGTNGTVRLSDCKAAVNVAGPSRRVFLVTNKVPRSWQNSNNRTLRQCDAAFPASRVYVVDWYSYATRNRVAFARDGFHVGGAAARAYAALIDAAVDRYGIR